MNRFVLLILVTAAIAALITYIAGRLSKNIKLVKYIPGALMLLTSVYYFYMPCQPSAGFEDLGRLILAIMLFAGGIGGIITALLMDYIASRKK